VFDLGEKIGEGEARLRTSARGILEQVEQANQQQADN
jgi:hypothetical protein